jgi:hypothetical protein
MGRVSVWFGQADSVKMQVRHVITINDCFGRKVRLTDERLAHILERTEMRGMREEMIRTLQAPAEVRVSRSDSAVRLFYEFYSQTRIGRKWLCIVVKYVVDDAFVITAYLTDRRKTGERVWPPE